VLVREFIGSKEGVPAKTLREKGLKDLEKGYEKIVESVARMFFLEELVHADLSEYNILVQEKNGEEELVIIDIGQAVLSTHPKAKEFFERDCKNISNYFSKKGLKKSPEEVLVDVKNWKEKLRIGAK
jgi:RIO kinase 1